MDTLNIATFAAFGGGECALLDWIEFYAEPDRAKKVLGRDPDFSDCRVISWGHVSFAEAQCILALEPDEEFHAEFLNDVRKLFELAELATVTFYFADSDCGY